MKGRKIWRRRAPSKKLKISDQGGGERKGGERGRGPVRNQAGGELGERGEQ